MGLKKGQTNNPKGRPFGALSAMAKEHRQNVAELLANNFDRVAQAMEQLTGIKLLRIYVDLLKYVVPPAQMEQDDDEQSPLIDEIINETKTKKEQRND